MSTELLELQTQEGSGGDAADQIEAEAREQYETLVEDTGVDTAGDILAGGQDELVGYTVEGATALVEGDDDSADSPVDEAGETAGSLTRGLLSASTDPGETREEIAVDVQEEVDRVTGEVADAVNQATPDWFDFAADNQAVVVIIILLLAFAFATGGTVGTVGGGAA